MNTTARTCPDVGEWRRWLDEPEFDVALGDHLADCAGCAQVIADLRADAEFAHERLGLTYVPDPSAVGAARERLRASRREPAFIARVTRFPTPWRVAAGGLAAALALALVVAFTPEGNSAAAAFLAQFRSQQVAALEVTPQSQADITRAMSALGNLGTLDVPAAARDGNPAAIARGQAQQARTATLAEATQTVGFKLSTPDPALLPAGADKTPSVRMTPGTQMRFTFDKNKARAYYQSTGHPEVTLPDKFDGATLSLSIPPAAMLAYGSGGTSGNRNELIVVQAGELVVDVQGKVSLPEMRDFLLGLPGLPPAVVNQLRQMQSWNNTLPIPVPVDIVNWKPTTIHGSQGLLLNDNSGVGSAAIWHANGHLYGVAGTLKADELKRVAESMAER